MATPAGTTGAGVAPAAPTASGAVGDAVGPAQLTTPMVVGAALGGANYGNNRKQSSASGRRVVLAE